ncbi:Spermidine N(1)-acetyltransferase [compost metagenome]
MIYQLSKEYFVRSLMKSDLDGPYLNWFEDQDVCKYNSHGKFFKTKAYFEDYWNKLNGQDRIVWAICHIDDGHIGNISLQEISLINRTGEFAILLGNKGHWGRGVGLLAGKKILEHGFYKLNLERVYCGTAGTNEGMKNLASAMGMLLEGTRRQHFFFDGARVDMLEYGILRSEFKISS